MSSAKRVYIGWVPVGGGAQITVQSMTNTYTKNTGETVAQIKRLANAGCQIVRIAVPDLSSAERIPEIISESPIPVIADIHFDYRIAIAAIKAGIHGIRLNPGNIRQEKELAKIADAINDKNIPVRVGANTGSISRAYRPNDSILKNEHTISDALVASALEQCRILEKYRVKNIKVSIKASDVKTTVLANRKFAKLADYPIHLGVTEAGTYERGIIKSSIGIGSLLLEGIGDTLRVSLTADPVEEVKAGIMILESIGLRTANPEIISCPTCGRTRINLFSLVNIVENEIKAIKATGKNLKLKKVAVMGCSVNGPGEARDADLGAAGANGKIAIFAKGKPIKICDESSFTQVFRNELLKFIS